MPSTIKTDKALPKSPEESMSNGTPRASSVSSDSSRAIHDVAEEDAPFEVYEMPSADGSAMGEAETPSGRATPTPKGESGRENATTPTPSTPTATTAAAALGSKAVNGNTRDVQAPTNTSNAKSIADLNKESGNKLRELLGSTRSETPKKDETKLDTPASTVVKKKSLSRLKASASSTFSHMPFGSPTSTPTRETHSNGTAPIANAGTQWASEKSKGGDGNTIAQLYAVFGLPKDPAVWTLAEEDCVAGVHHTEGAVGRFWRPEVLGCSICPSPADVLSDKELPTDKEDAASKWGGRDAGGKKPSNPKFIEMSDGRGGVDKAETARVLSKALKLSFTREIEIISEQGNFPPSATSHTFSFSVPTVSISTQGGAAKVAGAMGVSVGKANAANGVGEGYGLEPRATIQGNKPGEHADGPSLATFYGAVLTVWSAADEKRAKMIKKELTRAAKQRGSTGNPATSQSANAKRSASSATGWTDGSTDGDRRDDQDDGQLGSSLVQFAPNSTFFMPYAICIVSRYPLYNLLGDWNKMAWHKYSRNIEMHNQLMSTILRHPAPRLGEQFTVGSPDKDLSFSCRFPGALEWGTGLIGTDLTMWPLFKTLSLDNILTICEIALAANGRVLFQSRHPALLGMAVETIRYLVELCGWRGVANQNCHARDVKIYLEDPGSWIIAINTELRSIVKPAKEVCVVDLDINFVNCARPPIGAISARQSREKKRKRLMSAIFVSNVECSPPREFIEAYPGGRFRPLSGLVTREQNSAYEQLATPGWWNQTEVVQAFDKVLRPKTKQSFLQKLFNQKAVKNLEASEAELAAIMALRRRASTFVDARDGLENKIGRLNKRLAFLMSESDMWRAQFGKIQLLVDRLTKEANDLRGKVDKEKRESRRLSSTLAQRDMEQVQLQLQIKETESAREEAQAELIKMQRAMESLETEREAMMDEIRGVLSGVGGVEDVNESLARFDNPLPSFNPLIRRDSPTGSQISMTGSQTADYILRSRALAEAKISEGRPGRSTSRPPSSNGHIRSLSHDRGERQRRGATPMSAAASTTSHANHFPDDQMNYEIQQRTSVVTSQISRIQAQLENTLTQLEGRRNGAYDKDAERERRKLRRGSNASLSSRYEYRTPSSLGHGGVNMGGGSSIGHGTDNDHGEPYEYMQTENVKDDRDGTSTWRRRKELSRTTSASSDGQEGFNPLRAAVSPTATSPASTQPTSPTSVTPSMVLNGKSAQPTLTAKSIARQRGPSNPWKEAAVIENESKQQQQLPSNTEGDTSVDSSDASALQEVATPQAEAEAVAAPAMMYNSEVMLASKAFMDPNSQPSTYDSATETLNSPSSRLTSLKPDNVQIDPSSAVGASPLQSPIKDTYAAYNTIS